MARRSEAVAGSVLQTADASIPKTIIRFSQDKGCDSVLGLGCKAQRERECHAQMAGGWARAGKPLLCHVTLGKK